MVLDESGTVNLRRASPPGYGADMVQSESQTADRQNGARRSYARRCAKVTVPAAARRMRSWPGFPEAQGAECLGQRNHPRARRDADDHSISARDGLTTSGGPTGNLPHPLTLVPASHPQAPPPETDAGKLIPGARAAGQQKHTGPGRSGWCRAPRPPSDRGPRRTARPGPDRLRRAGSARLADRRRWCAPTATAPSRRRLGNRQAVAGEHHGRGPVPVESGDGHDPGKNARLGRHVLLVEGDPDGVARVRQRAGELRGEEVLGDRRPGREQRMAEIRVRKPGR